MGQVITFAQQKGGAGKTTILAHLAAAWTGEGLRVAIADLDPQGSLTHWIGLRGDPALTVIETRDYRARGDLRDAARNHDYVLVDCPGAASTMLDNALRGSDLMIVPCQPSAMDVWATAAILDIAATLKTPARIVFNRLPPRFAMIDEITAALGPSRGALLTATLGNRIAFAQSMLTGQTAPETGRRSKAAGEVAALRAEVEGVLAAA